MICEEVLECLKYAYKQGKRGFKVSVKVAEHRYLDVTVIGLTMNESKSYVNALTPDFGTEHYDVEDLFHPQK